MAHATALQKILLVALVCFSTAHAQSANPQPSATPQQINSVENLQRLDLLGSHLVADAPILGQTDTFPEYTRELLQLRWRHNDPIDLYIIRPVNVAKPPVTLFLYGYPTDSDRFSNDALCKNIVRHGIAAVGFVSAFTGQRYHDHSMKDWFVSQLPQALVLTTHDIQMILDYLSTRNDLNMNHVAIFGQGSGGAIALLAASVDPRLQIIDVMDPWGDWPDWLAHSPQLPESERSSYLKPDFLKTLTPFEPVSLLPELGNRKIRIQENLFNLAIPQPVREKIEDAGHNIAQVIEYHDQKEYTEKVTQNGAMLNWITEQIKDAEHAEVH